MAEEPIHISNGPGKWDLMVSLFEGNPTHRRKVRFEIPNGHRGNESHTELDVAITLVAQEDGSGESWLFEGYRNGSVRGMIHGYYSTRTRTGWYARGKMHEAVRP